MSIPHEPRDTGGGIANAKNPWFQVVNTEWGNIKAFLSGA